ncbi:MAG TPA: thioesterase family protein [Bryobacteraceae bacterium]|nr:thioesterase family protein [Bryobacteraceae bacterium]
MEPRFRYYLRVRYGECDAQKVVFNSRYAEYIDIAAAEFLRAIGFGAAFFNGHLDYQLVKQTVAWKAAARFDQVLELAVGMARVGNTSFSLAMDIRVAGEERIIVTAETVYVLVDAKTVGKISVPPDLRSALERGAPGTVTDHAGYLARTNSRG